MHDWKETMQWYRENDTASQLGFDPDGMCLKICRTARDLEAMFPSAVAAQEATPKEHRVHAIRDLRRGMVLYYDDPNDSNRFGHIVTMIGRVKGANPDDLHDVLVETNSVVANQVVVVRGDYFEQHWGDDFKFGATWLNGHVLDVLGSRERDPHPNHDSRLENFWETRPEWDVNILERAVKKGNRHDIRAKLFAIRTAVEELPDDLKDERVDKVKRDFKKDGILKLNILNAYLNDHPNAVRVEKQRNRLRMIIKSLPRH